MIRLDRLSAVILLFAGLWLVLLLQTFRIQIIESDKYSAVANNQAHSRIIAKPERGKIYDRNGRVFAETIKSDTNGTLEDRRLFTQGTLASQLIGQVGHDGQGLRGLEFMFDERLRGIDGWQRRVKDAKSRVRPGLDDEGRAAVPGMNLVLTIDRDMQEIVENALKTGVENYQAESGSAIVVDPQTGEILAMASYPTYDPNAGASAASRANRNDIVSLAFEPGSIFKLVTASTAIEEHAVDPEKVFSGEGGRWTLPDGSLIRDTHDHGDMNMTQAMAKSSNIVFAKIADEIGPTTFYRYVRAFGFGSKTLVDIPGEESGVLKPVPEWSGRTLKTMGFGHEILVTPLQMAMAFSVVANGGKLMQPTIVREWLNPDGSVDAYNEPVVVRRVISEETAARVRTMLREVVLEGTGKSVVSSKLPDMDFGGKTGTAEKYSQELKRYDHTKQVASFIGLAPVQNPRYVCMVLVDDPKTFTVGGLTAGPVFRSIMEGIYMNPRLSPVPYNLVRVSPNTNCNVDFVGLSKPDAMKLSAAKNCPVNFSSDGSVVVSQKRNMETGSGLVLAMNTVVASRMPDLKGLSLRDALDILGNVRASVKYTGKGRVVDQFPVADSPLSRGMECRLVLKERG